MSKVHQQKKKNQPALKHDTTNVINAMLMLHKIHTHPDVSIVILAAVEATLYTTEKIIR
jgi:hypothetical protein